MQSITATPNSGIKRKELQGRWMEPIKRSLTDESESVRWAGTQAFERAALALQRLVKMPQGRCPQAQPAQFLRSIIRRQTRCTEPPTPRNNVRPVQMLRTDDQSPGHQRLRKGLTEMLSGP